MTRVDTNYIVRYLINDNVEMANIAEDVLMNKNVFIANEILAEVVYVLLGVYQISKDEIADQLIELIDFENISTTNHGVAVQALKIFKTKSLDFVDCLLCAYSQHDEIVTFDKKLTKCILQK
jgi:predicted nucleic-acid-binding protein